MICKNEFGWSRWSTWAGPFTPQEGVVVRQYGEGWLKIGWVEPILSNGRAITKYEVQMCRSHGAMSSKVSVYKGTREERRANSGVASNDFKTVGDDYTVCEAEIRDLLPGKKYQFRVRPCIDNEWNTWEVCLVSDVLTIPSTAPDVPHSVKAILLPEFENDSVQSGNESKSRDSFDDENKLCEKVNPSGVGLNGGEEFGENKPFSKSKAVQSLRRKVDSQKDGLESNAEELLDRNVSRFSISHNSIDIQWVNGTPNGSTIQEVEIQAAKIREYHVDDIEKAAKAAGTEVTWDEALAQSLKPDEVEDLEWVNITNKGIFMGADRFRATGLISGASYVFRVRQRNDVHWSSFSKASRVITTLIASPPMSPEIIMVAPGHVVAEWKISPDASFVFSSLRSDLRIAYFDDEGKVNHEDIDVVENAANRLNWWSADQQPTKSSTGEIYEQCDRVLVDSLKPMTTYVLKVRVLTVAGWTTWSAISKPFRTLALP